MRKYNDNSVAPIIAIDFDNTISIGDKYPECGKLRPYAKEVINFLTDIGVKIVIYTSRDAAINQDEQIVCDDLTPMITYLKENGIRYASINKSVQFAPFLYNSRKVYAHRYLDDRNFGFTDNDDVFLGVLYDTLAHLLDVPVKMAADTCEEIRNNHEVKFCEIEQYKGYVKEFWK